MKVTYISHSGFLIETENCLFLFDYYEGKIPPLSQEKPLFISGTVTILTRKSSLSVMKKYITFSLMTPGNTCLQASLRKTSVL